MAASSSSPKQVEDLPPVLLVKKDSTWGFFIEVLNILQDSMIIDTKNTSFFVSPNDEFGQGMGKRPAPGFIDSKVCMQAVKKMNGMFDTEHITTNLDLEKVQVDSQDYVELPVNYVIILWYMGQFVNPADGNMIGQDLFGIPSSRFETAPICKGAETLLAKYFPMVPEGTTLTLHLFWLIVNGLYFIFIEESSQKDEGIYISTSSSLFLELHTNMQKNPAVFKKKVRGQIELENGNTYVVISYDFFIQEIVNRRLQEYVSIWVQTRDQVFIP